MSEDINIKTEYYQNTDNKKFKITKIEKEEIHNRSFDGIWIPKFIWLNKELNILEKCIFAEIHSLDTKEKGCYASNKYFSKFFNLTEQNISKHISKLKQYGLIYEEKFDGRKRILRSVLKIKGLDLLKIDNDELDLSQLIRQTKRKQQSRFNKNDKQYNIVYNKDYELSKDNKEKETFSSFFESDFSPIKKELIIYFDLYKKLHPLARKESFFKKKKINKINTLVKYILNGFPNNNFNKLKTYLIEKNIPYNPSIGLNNDLNKLKELLNNSLLSLDMNYQPSNKERITANFEEFLFNDFTGFSFFFTYGYSPPKLLKQEIQERKLKNKHPDYTEKLCNILNININDDVISYINRLVKKNIEIKLYAIDYENKTYTRETIELEDNPDPDYNNVIRNLNGFMREYFYWLEEQLDNNTFKFEFKFFDNNFKLFEKYIFDKFDRLAFYPGKETMVNKVKNYLGE